VTLEERALSLLLRSPRLSVSLILDLLEMGDAELRDIATRHPDIAQLLEDRRTGSLTLERPSSRQCPACAEWFVPYGGARFCSDPCRTIGRMQRAS
jgi:hypothetical protein